MTLLLLLTACLLAAAAGGVGYWRWKSTTATPPEVLPPAGNYTGLRSFHYQLSDYQPANTGAVVPAPAAEAVAEPTPAVDQPAQPQAPGEWLASLADLLDELDAQAPSTSPVGPPTSLPPDWAYTGEGDATAPVTHAGMAPAEAN